MVEHVMKEQMEVFIVRILNSKELFEKINIENKNTVHLMCNKKNNQFIKNILIEVEII